MLYVCVLHVLFYAIGDRKTLIACAPHRPGGINDDLRDREMVLLELRRHPRRGGLYTIQSTQIVLM